MVDANVEFLFQVSEYLNEAVEQAHRKLRDKGVLCNHHIVLVNGYSIKAMDLGAKIKENDNLTFVPIVFGG